MRFVFIESHLERLNPGHAETYRPIFKKIMSDWPLQLGLGENSFISKACELEREIGLKKNSLIFQTNNFAKQDAIERGLGNPESAHVQTMMINFGMLRPCFEMGEDEHLIISEMTAGICIRNLVAAQLAGFSQLYAKSKNSPKDRQELMSKADEYFKILQNSLIHAESKFSNIRTTLELREESAEINPYKTGEYLRMLDISMTDIISKTDFHNHVREHCDRNQVSFEKISAALNLNVIMEL